MASISLSSIRAAVSERIDRVGVTLSALCAVHCLASIVLVSALGIGGEFLLAPAIHEVGLALAMVIAAVAIGAGALRHRRAAPFVTAMTGLSFMGAALAVGHGFEEAVLTIIGVALVSVGHILNLRRCGCSLSGGHDCSQNADR
ncbi:MAG: MerC domain-containing protein [Tsuneonella suprasediminis]|nr:MerC domain-containing protein [Altererythrobacter sp. N1]